MVRFQNWWTVHRTCLATCDGFEFSRRARFWRYEGLPSFAIKVNQDRRAHFSQTREMRLDQALPNPDDTDRELSVPSPHGFRTYRPTRIHGKLDSFEASNLRRGRTTSTPRPGVRLHGASVCSSMYSHNQFQLLFCVKHFQQRVTHHFQRLRTAFVRRIVQCVPRSVVKVYQIDGGQTGLV